MNKKVTIENSSGKIVYCVLDGNQSLQSQINEVFGHKQGQGYSAEIDEKEIIIRDYFAGDVRACLKVISIEDTNEEVCFNWKTEIPVIKDGDHVLKIPDFMDD